MVVLAFAALGIIVPIVFHFLLSYVDSAPQAHYKLGRFLLSAIPYLWPSAPVLLALEFRLL